MNQEMQERAYEKVETLWPYAGFTVRAVEKKLGEGRLTLTGKSLLFERNDGLAIGFGFPNLRLIRLKDVHTIELPYSLQGELRRGPRSARPPGPRPDTSKRAEDHRNRTLEQTLAVLTAEQKETWQRLIGESFKGEIRQRLPMDYGPRPPRKRP